MNERRSKRLSLRGPITLFVVILVLVVTLTVLWHVALVQDYRKLRALAAQDEAFHWTFIALGSVLFLAIITCSSILGGQLIGHIRWSRRQSNFIASVSHELNSPLSSIKLFAQTLHRRDLDTADRVNFVEKILFDVERLQRLIANILRAAEVDNRGEELMIVLQRVELTAYLQEFIADATALNADRELEVSLEAGPELWLSLDRMMFRQVLDNLIDNAVRYSVDGPPRIVIRVATLPEQVEIRVTDHGVGVAEEELGKIFERFYRAEGDQTRRQRKGTGIGLFVVRSIVQAHGGRVKAFSDGPGRGTTISIRLPRPSAHANEGRRRRAAQRVAGYLEGAEA